MRGRPSWAAIRHTISVCTSTPSTALTTNTARSATERAAETSGRKSAYPGQSRMLTLQPSYSNGASATDTEIDRFTSSASKSVVVVPSSTRPCRLMAPAQNSRASASVVLPAPPCPTSATLRIRAGGYVFTRHLTPGGAAPPDGPRNPEVSGSRWYLEEDEPSPSLGALSVRRPLPGHSGQRCQAGWNQPATHRHHGRPPDP